MSVKRHLGTFLLRLGFDPRLIAHRVLESPKVRRELKAFNSQRSNSPFARDFPHGRDFRVYGERKGAAGVASGHYFHQDLLVAREINRRNPVRHIDVGSRIDGFVAHLASFRKVEVIDIRPLPAVHGIDFIQADMMNLPECMIGAADSVSCLHALEHFGLGRYGDPIDFDGWHKGLRSLMMLLKPHGILYLSVPTGHIQRVEFNAHRVFTLTFLQTVLGADFDIVRCSFVHDDGSLTEDIDLLTSDADQSFLANYGLSIWTLQRRAEV